ncbi:MAG: polysaccharide biosynthesis/export family protein [Bacteroidales bacterium]|nr:polysaccharide biosynthesis/export family protein [Bacteroidales bacterium]
MYKILFFCFVLVILFPSCIHNKIRYLQDKSEIFETISEYSNKEPEYKIQKNDILYVKISSTNEDINKYFNNSESVNNLSQAKSFFLDGYTVNENGFIKLQILGDIKVDSLSIKEVQEKVQKKTDEFLNNASVTVKLVSFYLTFLGEVNNQGKISVLQDNINILDGLALAGGITDYGDKRKVFIVRTTSTGTKTFSIDLTKRELLISSNYYLLPNDIIIVEPLINKSFRLGVADYTTILTTITSTATLILLMISLF